MGNDLENGGASREKAVSAEGTYPQRAIRDDISKQTRRVVDGDDDQGEPTIIFTDWASI